MLSKEIDVGRIITPVYAYRDEGTSYHYAEPADYIEIKTAPITYEFFKDIGRIPVIGRTWTTDALFRETQLNIDKRVHDGCVSVEMEVAAVQAVCDFYNINFYTFLIAGDSLAKTEWDPRIPVSHKTIYADLAIRLGEYVCEVVTC